MPFPLHSIDHALFFARYQAESIRPMNPASPHSFASRRSGKVDTKLHGKCTPSASPQGRRFHQCVIPGSSRILRPAKIPSFLTSRLLRSYSTPSQAFSIMSLPRPGGYPVEKKSAGGRGGYGGGGASSSNVFAGYNPPSSNPNAFSSAGIGTFSGQGQGQGVSGFPMDGGYGSGGIGGGSSSGGGSIYSGGSGVFGNSGVSASGAEGGAGPGMRGSSTGKWDQYGFSGPGLSSGAPGIGDGGVGASGIGGSQGQQSSQQPLNWQWAPEGMNAEVCECACVFIVSLISRR